MIDIDAIIDSMEWSLDADERKDMRRLCQATLKAAAEQSGEVVGYMRPRHMERLRQEDDRQAPRWAQIYGLPFEDFATPVYRQPQPMPAMPEEWRSLLKELALYSPQGICAPTALQGFAMRAARMLTAAPATGKESLQVQAVPESIIEGAARKLAADFDYPWEYMPEAGKEDFRGKVRKIAALLASPSPN
ncbi:hypothetical protein DK842_18180 [Chromobacterium phragmitis]|uniref:hypothetical protein n=1 Tax=Chromobacterium phragmitis TaxID=2202141 RepID=UPI000DED1638|nr:hypothetical protein [Chromobacterium phragmitis]AXE31658.1 hypothetical protein DK842_18180 [Chromobacterium phragmitis]